MTAIANVRHERVDDIPVIIGMANRLGLADILDRHLGRHGLHQGLNNGQLAVGWLGYILSQGDHRKSAVQGWAHDLTHTLEQLLGDPIREVEFSDDRLGILVRRLNDDGAWAAIETDLWAATMTVYAFPVTGVRLDGSSSYGYHQVHGEGLMQYGHSKDHRPDLPQLKLMAAAAAPWGHLIACDVAPGQRPDDPLYPPLLERVRRILGQEGLLYAGDCKMAALSIRADIVLHRDYYVVPLPLTGKTGEHFAAWVAAVVDGPQEVQLLWEGNRWLGAGYEFERLQTATVGEQTVTWTERVQVLRSPGLAERQQADLERRLEAATAALGALTPEPGRGKRQVREEAALQEAITRVLAEHQVAGLLTGTWERQEQEITRYQGRGRGGPNRPTTTVVQVRYVVTGVHRNAEAIAAQRHRMGWRVQVTNAPVDRLPLVAAVREGRDGWSLERDFHLIKDLPLGLSPLFVWKEDQIKGLTRLLTLGLRLLTLIEIQVRQELAQEQTTVAGLYEGQPHRATDRPTGKRILKAFARAQITWTWVETVTFPESPLPDRPGAGAGSPGPEAAVTWKVAHITPLSPLLERLLHYLRLPPSLYSALAYNTS